MKPSLFIGIIQLNLTSIAVSAVVDRDDPIQSAEAASHAQEGGRLLRHRNLSSSFPSRSFWSWSDHSLAVDAVIRALRRHRNVNLLQRCAESRAVRTVKGTPRLD